MILEALIDHPILLYGCLFCFGLIFGSFLNVVIHRMPIMLDAEWTQQCYHFLGEKAQDNQCPLCQQHASLVEQHYQVDTSYNLTIPRSRCTQCEKQIAWYDNIPLFSYLLLKGKCRHCQASISIQYPLIELISACLLSYSAYHFGLTMAFVGSAIFGLMLIALTMIDFKHQLLPDDITQPLLWIGLLFNAFQVYTTLKSAVLGAIIGYFSFWLVYQIFKLITKKEGMGFGDFKLLAAIGAWLGWQQLPFIVLFSSLFGSIVGIGFILTGRDKDTPFAFGPYLAMTGLIAMFWGKEIYELYISYWT